MDRTSRQRLAHIAGIFDDINASYGRAPIGQPTSLQQINDHVASLEGAINMEITARKDLESRVMEAVDSRVRLMMDRLADATEQEVERLFREKEHDMQNSIDSLSRDMGSLTHLVSRMSSTIENLVEDGKRSSAQLNKLQEWALALDSTIQAKISQGIKESSVNGPPGIPIESLNNFVSRDVMEMTVEKLRSDLKESSERFVRFDKWFRENITPELIRLRTQLELETKTREESSNEVVEIVDKYAEIMKRHFSAPRYQLPPVSSLTSGRSSN